MTTEAKPDSAVDQQQLQSWVSEAADRLAVPGVAVGVFIDGNEQYALHGITSVENPLPVDENTLWQMGSTGKTHTGTAIMRLVDQGRVELEAPVRTYVPELRLKDEEVAEKVTVLHLLNHTAGWEGDLLKPTGDGDDALERYVENMANLEQVSPLGTAVSYNNASIALAGRLIQNVTGQVYEHAMKDLIFKPLGLDHSFFFPNEVMTRRFAVGHNQSPDGSIKVARPWALPRGAAPAGGIACNSKDLVTWARFHLGDGRSASGTSVLSEKLLKQMQEPTADASGSAIGDQIGITWLLREVDGVRLVQHGGDTLGQHSNFVMVPDKGFAISTLTNCGPNGSQFNEEVVRWALEAYAGVIDRDPEPISLDEGELAGYTGTYETIAAICNISAKDGGLLVLAEIRPEVLKELVEQGEEAPESQPIPLGLLAGPGDRYIVTEGPAKGMKGYFVRNASGEIESVHLGGRLATRVPAQT